MRVQVVGYAWYMSGSSEYLATVVVVLYMLVALAHTAWVLGTGVTSSSWDTVTELLALALQSPVSGALQGTGANIERLGTYRRLVRLRVIEEGVEPVGAKKERLVLIVDREERNASMGRIDIDKKYL